MKIRALTGFLDPGWPLDREGVADVAGGLAAVKMSLERVGQVVQTLRIATPPCSEMEKPVPPQDRPKLAGQLEAECFIHGLDYASIGPALPGEPEGYEVIPEVLGSTESIFASGMIADQEFGVSLDAVQACARVIASASSISADGFANLRFAALANVPPGSAYFPAAYHRGGTPALAVATEAADLAVEALQDAPSLEVARQRMVNLFENHARSLSSVLQRVAPDHGLRFIGVDFSLAPFPESLSSVGTALEALGLPALGLAGSAAAVAFLAECLDQAQFERTGFCGIMLPVLEDVVLAQRATEGLVSVTDLLMYSTLCGTGLDTVPLPGEATAAQMAAVLMDLGALALRLNKPLTARLMPIPGKSAGDEIAFDFPYFAQSRVVALEAKPLGGLLGGSGTLDIGPHRL